jgi:ferric-dicitrate binding protein FerR (iron transport regulator)
MLNKWLQNDSFLRWRLFRSKEDQLFWDNFLQENPGMKKEIDEAIQLLKSVRLNDYKLLPEDKLTIYEWIQKAIDRKRKHKRIRLYVAASAAVACIALFLLLSDGSSFRPDMRKDTLSAVTADSLVNEKDIRLLLADNQTMTFDRDADIHYHTQGDIVVNAGSKQVVTQETKPGEVKLNTLIVPNGKRSSLTLEDGTKVWINSGSTLEFPAVFQSGKREIRVEGEIYIEVAKKQDQPFYVNSSRMSVEVTGTRFNVSAYKEDSNHSVVLVEGSVDVNAGEEIIHLLPDQRLSVAGNHFVKEKVNVYDYISWKDGLLQFSSEPLSQILTRLSRYYDIPIECEKEIENIKCTGKLVLFDDIQDVLQTIHNTVSISWTVRENRIYIQK